MTDRVPPESVPGTDPGPGTAFGDYPPGGGAASEPDVANSQRVASGSERDPGSPAGPASAQNPPGAGPSVDEPAGAAGGSGSTESTGFEEDPLAVAQRERDEYKDALIRLQADFENYKKRMLKQQTEHLERAAGALVEKLLPVLDAADLALAHGAGEDVKQLTAALFAALEREGLERIDPAGGPFDPTLHDAVAHEPADGDQQEQQVAEVMRAGYRWKGRVLRPAMVKVRG